YFEHMPLRASALPDGAAMRIHGRHRFGRLAELFVLDSRQYRTPQACPKPRRGGGNSVAVERCPDLFDPGRSMLGLAQERWLDRCFSESAARWNLIGQQTLFSHVSARRESGTLVRTDGWSGYPVARQRLIDSIQAHRLANPVVLGGDVHANWVCDVKADFGAAGSSTVATEFCATSITSQGRAQIHHDRARDEHAHVHLAESEHRGYVVVALKPGLCTTTLRTVDDVRLPRPAITTRARFVVESGRPGAVLD
ncbi:MAG TPA: alkaline phosphatase D family protein, partial [Burkholderiaceae bacterium]|nr:alkaline phosphatase D family protein [Burkholderiaceae bacterium]